MQSDRGEREREKGKAWNFPCIPYIQGSERRGVAAAPEALSNFMTGPAAAVKTTCELVSYTTSCSYIAF